jgi:hypothetical protein
MNARPTTSSSNLFRRALCPGSHWAEDGLPEETSEQAEEGHDLHALAADPTKPRTHLEDEQLRTLNRAEEIEAEIYAVVIQMHGLEEAEFQEGHEKELQLHRGLKLLWTGHCDRWRYYPAAKVLIITDKKFGRTAVPSAARNLQLRSYAVQGAEEWDCDAVYVGIVQPRLPKESAKSVARYTRADLIQARYELLAIWDRAQGSGAPRVASADACEYCKAKVGCPEFRALISTATPLVAVPAKDLTTDQLSTCLTAISLLSDAWVKGIKAEARARIEAGTLPGYMLVENSPRRSIKDAPKAFERLLAAGFSELQLLQFAGLTVGNAIKLYQTRGNTGAEASKAIQNLLGPLLVSTEVAPSIEKL